MPARRPSDLDVVYRRLRTLAERTVRADYRIPALWNCWGYDEARPCGRGEVAVNPYDFAGQCLERIILPARGPRRLAGRSLSRLLAVRRVDRTGRRPTLPTEVLDSGSKRRGGDWIRSANIYGLLVRAAAAWDHDGDGSLNPSAWTETGTFVKAILLLPLLARLGLDTIYLLPVTKIGRAFRKGEVGCPYSTQNFFEFDPELHERLLDEPGETLGGRGSRRGRARLPPSRLSRSFALPEISIETQFGAFVEAAHALGLRVMIDLAPRTAARDSDLILEHPDWFYWIDSRRVREYGPPHLEGVPRGVPAPSELRGIFAREVMQRHLSLFRFGPDVTDPSRWRRFVEHCRRVACAKGFSHQRADVLRGIIREFGVVTPPGFSDVVNDPQPPWSDVTFLRLFLDHPAASARHLPDPAGQPPYVFADTIKASRFPGRRPNRPLWRFLAGILPFYQRFGIDGARVDMGHALPPGLQRMIIERPQRIDPDFCFLAEELDHVGGRAARRDGYNAIIGSSWRMQPRHAEGQLHEFVHEVLPAAPLPAFAAAETPDTPRATTRDGGPAFAKLIGVLNCFLPSAFPFVHSGFELLERQPLNLGLDPPGAGQRSTLPLSRGRYMLPRRDPYHGKLGYFDRVALHWGNAGAAEMVELLARASAIRRRFIADLIDARNYFAPRVSTNRRWIVAVGWKVRARNGRARLPPSRHGRRQATARAASSLLVLTNIDFRNARECTIVGLGRDQAAACETLLRTPNRGPGDQGIRGSPGPLVPRSLAPRPPDPPDPRTPKSLRVVLAPGEVKILLCCVETRNRGACNP